MAVERFFLGWGHPFLPTLVEHFIKSYRVEDRLYLDGLLLVFPGDRAHRRFLELLVQAAEHHGLELIPPLLITSGGIFDLCFSPDEKLPTELQRIMAWTVALETCDEKTLRVLTSRDRRTISFSFRLGLAQKLDDLYKELSSAGLSFHQVAELCHTRILPDEERWMALGELHSVYQSSLEEGQILDREAELISDGAIKEDSIRKILLCGVADLPPLAREILDRSPQEKAALIYAPEEEKDGFDDFGRLIPDKWLNRSLSLSDASLHFFREFHDEGVFAKETTVEWGGTYSSSEITIGCTNEILRDEIIHALQSEGVQTSSSVGRPLTNTPPVKVLEALGNFLENRRFRDFAALLRQPHIDEWVRKTARERDLPLPSLIEIDSYFDTCVPAFAIPTRMAGLSRKIRNLFQISEELFDGFLKNSSKAPAEWVQETSQCLVRLFGQSPLKRFAPSERPIAEAGLALKEILEEVHHGILGGLLGRVPTLSALEFLRIIFIAVQRRRIDPEPTGQSIEVIGWLDLALDDAPAALLCGCYDGALPESIQGDEFLPNQLRRELGILTNEGRLARDNYLMTTLIESRERLHLSLSRFGERGIRLLPSPLLFLTDPETTARRVATLFPKELEESKGAGSTESSFPAPIRPLLLDQLPSTLSVTALSAYSTCPYQFYLKYVLRLNRLDDSARELHPGRLGSVLHSVLEEFAKSPVTKETDPETIYEFLCEAIDDLTARVFGPSPLGGILLQLRQLRHRLSLFAEWQAARVSDGWEIFQTEFPISSINLSPLMPGFLIPVEGRIDRIDYHPHRNEWCILDYKTGEKGKRPDKTHQRKKEWVEFQLPLYYWFLKAHPSFSEVPPDKMRLGYLNLSPDSGTRPFESADWNETELDEALRHAISIVEAIAGCKFWPPRSPFEVPRELAPLFGENCVVTSHGS